MKLVIQGRLPSLNEYINIERTSRQMAAKFKREVEDTIIWCAKASRLGKIKTPVVMHYRWYEKTMKRDKDNISSFGRKVIQDALVRAKYLPGDGWAYIAGFTDTFEVDPKNPRIEVEFE